MLSFAWEQSTLPSLPLDQARQFWICFEERKKRERDRINRPDLRGHVKNNTVVVDLEFPLCRSKRVLGPVLNIHSL